LGLFHIRGALSTGRRVVQFSAMDSPRSAASKVSACGYCALPVDASLLVRVLQYWQSRLSARRYSLSVRLRTIDSISRQLRLGIPITFSPAAVPQRDYPRTGHYFRRLFFPQNGRPLPEWPRKSSIVFDHSDFHFGSLPWRRLRPQEVAGEAQR